MKRFTRTEIILYKSFSDFNVKDGKENRFLFADFLFAAGKCLKIERLSEKIPSSHNETALQVSESLSDTLLYLGAQRSLFLLCHIFCCYFLFHQRVDK